MSSEGNVMIFFVAVLYDVVLIMAGERQRG